MLNDDDKRPVLEFGMIRSVIGFEGGKLPKIVFTDFEGLHHITLRSKRKTLPVHLSIRCVMDYLKTRKVDGSREKGVWERIPQVDLLR